MLIDLLLHLANIHAAFFFYYINTYINNYKLRYTHTCCMVYKITNVSSDFLSKNLTTHDLHTPELFNVQQLSLNPRARLTQESWICTEAAEVRAQVFFCQLSHGRWQIFGNEGQQTRKEITSWVSAAVLQELTCKHLKHHNVRAAASSPPAIIQVLHVSCPQAQLQPADRHGRQCEMIARWKKLGVPQLQCCPHRGMVKHQGP